MKKITKKSTTKYSGKRKKNKRGRIPLIIPIIAVIEVAVLVVVCTYSWYFVKASKTMSTGIITVAADSGLDIDFKDADDNDYIDIWNYIDKDFAFEPATSTDGRNIYFPTSGTFENTNTVNMKFRDGTVNDINSKYINIDFELTNTNTPVNDPNHPEYDIMDVYLSSRSSFTIKENVNDQRRTNGSALRLALYNNDGNSGKIGSTMIEKMHDGLVSKDETNPTKYTTVYFYAPRSNYTPYAYIWYRDGSNNDSAPKKSWPGTQMTWVSGRLYKYTFENKMNGNSVAADNYNRVIFSNSYSGYDNESATFVIQNGNVYHKDGAANSTGSPMTLRTVYFVRPDTWGVPKIYLAKNNNPSGNDNFIYDNNTAYDQSMTEVTPGIYSYYVPTGFDYFKIHDPNSSYSSVWTNIGQNDGKLFYLNSVTSTSASLTAANYELGYIYFYNTHVWETPKAHVNAFPASTGYTFEMSMIPLSGNVYYCKLPSAFLSDKAPNASASNCTVYFTGKAEGDASDSRTKAETCTSNRIYRPTFSFETVGSVQAYVLTVSDYSEAAVSTEGTGNYAVISPGVSAGFQRSSNPVDAINFETGAVTTIIPTFASSFDDYIYGSGNPIFQIAAGQTISMSLIIWLEGTDEHCTGENYAAKLINLYLEFVTSVSLGGDDSAEAREAEKMYDYEFIDRTEQIWTSDQINVGTTTHPVFVDPVMQLYDKTIQRGYLMEPKYTETYGKKQKVREWTCHAPASLVTDSDNSGKKKKHDIEFRRVNPYNEDEIWNRWDAGLVYDYRQDAMNGNSASGTTVYFTAFADGSPDDSLYDFDVPTRSCGGLWGDVEVEQLVCYDGRSTRDIGSTGNTLTIRYTYTYPNSNLTQDIEYRTSGQWRDYQSDAEKEFEGDGTYCAGFYGFVVPKNIYSNATYCRFNLYSGFDDDYAINSDINDSIELTRTWFTYNTSDSNDHGRVNGNFFSFNEKNSAAPDNAEHTARSGNYHSYWGSDVIYIQAEAGMDLALNSSNNDFQMHYYYEGVGNNFYSYIYKNDGSDGQYKGSSSDYGAYISVIPSDHQINRYVFQVNSKNSTSSWLSTSALEIGYNTVDSRNSNYYHNSTIKITNGTVERNYSILKLSHRCRIFLHNNNWTGDWAGSTMRAYWWNSDGVGHDYEMTQKENKDGHIVYVCDQVDYGASVFFYVPNKLNDGNTWRTQTSWNSVNDNQTYHIYGRGTYGDDNEKALIETKDWVYDTTVSSGYLKWDRYNSLNYSSNGTRIHVPCYTPDNYRDT